MTPCPVPFRRFVSLVILVALAGCAGSEREPERGASATSRRTEVSGLPAGWRAGTTGGAGAVPVWEHRGDASAPSGGEVLVMTSPEHQRPGAFNLAWDPAAGFLDGSIRVRVKAIRGQVDQGGGPMWRAQGVDDYYVCRWNPLESNFRVYVVSRGVRRQLATADATAADGWHEIAIEQEGSRILCSFDGQELLDVTDETITTAGGVGVWTKADAVTAFDGLAVN